MLMTSGELFLEFDAEAAAIRQDCTRLFPFDRVTDQFEVKGPSCLGRFQDQQVGRACSQPDIRGPLIRYAPTPAAGSLPRHYVAVR